MGQAASGLDCCGPRGAGGWWGEEAVEKKKITLKPGQLVISDAAYKGDLGGVRSRFRGNTEEEDADGNTPMHWASVKGHHDVLEELINKNFPVNKKNKDGDTALHWAASSGRDKCVALLINADADLCAANNDETTPLHFASAEGHHEVVRLIVSRLPHPPAALQKPRPGKKVDEGKINLRTKDGDTPLHWGSASAKAEVCEELLSHGALPNAQNKDGNTPLHVACAEGAFGIVTVLIENNADVNVVNGDSEGPVHWACSGGHRHILATLLEEKAEATRSNQYGEQPIHFAVQKGDLAMLELLIEHGASPETPTKMGDSCLHLAVTRCDVQMISKIGDLATVQMLVECGAEINAKNENEETPLHWAAASGHPVIVKYLLQNHAKTDVDNRQKRRPKDLASDVQTLAAFPPDHKEIREQQQRQKGRH